MVKLTATMSGRPREGVNRRSFLKGLMLTGGAMGGVATLAGSTVAKRGLTQGLIAHYPLNRIAQDGTVRDLSRQNNDGTNHGAEVTSGHIGKALSFTQEDRDSVDFIEVPDDPSLDIIGPYTEAAWVKMDRDGGKNDITMKDPTQWALGFQVRNGTLRAGFENEADRNYIVIGGSVKAGEWTHVAVRYDGSTVKGYIDGESIPDTVETKGATPATNDRPLTIGKGAGEFDGSIDDLRIYDRALSRNEIERLSKMGGGGGKGNGRRG